MPVCIAQVDLKKAFDIIAHSKVARMSEIAARGCLAQLVEGQFSGRATWPCCHRAARHGGPRNTARGSRKRIGVRSWSLVRLWVDYVRDGKQATVMKCDNVDLICFGYAVDIFFFLRSKASLEVMIDDCCDAFRPGRP